MQTIHQLYNKSGNDENRDGFRHYSLPPAKGVFLFLDMLCSAVLYENLLSHAHAENAEAMTRYMKNKFSFLGIKSSPRRLIFGKFLELNQGADPLTAHSVVAFVRDCWSYSDREMHYCGVDLLVLKQNLLTPDHLADLEWLAAHNAWWDTVDLLATKVMGPLLRRHPEVIETWISRWMNSRDVWLQRCCILFQLKYKQGTDTDQLAGVITDLKDHPDFFIRKAIGWILREYSKTSPQFVLHFVATHQLAPLSHREGLKHLRHIGYLTA